VVRAKIDAIRAAQGASADASAPRWAQFERRVALAQQFARGPRPFLAITCGVSGSGKTYASALALERSGAIRVRSDVERKRIAGMEPQARSASGIDAGVYTRAASDRTFARLAELARIVIESGYGVIVDATFIERERREPFRALAASLGIPFLVLHCRAPEHVLAQRIERRLAAGADASEADLRVLQAQRQRQQSVQPHECTELIEVDSNDPASIADMVNRLARIAGTG
jgi:predicted kinase